MRHIQYENIGGTRQGEPVGETPTPTPAQASLPMHQTRLRLGVVATELVFRSLDEVSESDALFVKG